MILAEYELVGTLEFRGISEKATSKKATRVFLVAFLLVAFSLQTGAQPVARTA
jgi:hypothetical protein